MMKLYNKLLSVLIVIVILILILFSFFMVDGFIEEKNVNKQIDEFKNRGQLIYTIDNVNYYKVIKKYDYEDGSNVFRGYNNPNVGTTGDILMTNRDPIDFFLTKWISKHCYIGHAAMVYSESGDKMVEIVGNESPEVNMVRIMENKWVDEEKHNSLFLRVKNINNEDKENLINDANCLLGCKYNYTFIFHNKKRFCCFELVSHMYKNIGINLNEDYFFTTGNDFTINDETYIIYYKERYIKDNKICYNIYYLSEE